MKNCQVKHGQKKMVEPRADAVEASGKMKAVELVSPGLVGDAEASCSFSAVELAAEADTVLEGAEASPGSIVELAIAEANAERAVELAPNCAVQAQGQVEGVVATLVNAADVQTNAVEDNVDIAVDCAVHLQGDSDPTPVGLEMGVELAVDTVGEIPKVNVGDVTCSRKVIAAVVHEACYQLDWLVMIFLLCKAL